MKHGCYKQNREVTPQKTADVRPPTTDLTNNLRRTNKSFGALLKKQRRNHMFPSFMDYLSCGCPRGVMVKAMNCGIVVREFVLQSRYYVHFRANTLGKGMNPLILPPAMGK